MNDDRNQVLGLIVRQAPYAQRCPRAQLDVALAAAVLELPLEVYFLGDSVWQLAAERDTSMAKLPGGLKGWAALPGMTSIRFFAAEGQCLRMRQQGAEPIVTVEELNSDSMARRWRACVQVMAL